MSIYGYVTLGLFLLGVGLVILGARMEDAKNVAARQLAEIPGVAGWVMVIVAAIMLALRIAWKALSVVLLLVFVSAAYAGALPSPDDALTPGDTRSGALHAPRGHTPAAVMKEVNRRYAIGQDDTVAEYDHRIPWGCGGATSADNLWPQSSPAKERKDKLEHLIERLVTQRKLTAAECQAMFRAPNHWQDQYRAYYGEDP